jgi:hypothetical protein
LDGTIQVTATKSGVEHTSFSGPVAVTVTAGGVGYATTDYGEGWHTFRMPHSLGVLDPFAEQSGGPAPERSCSLLGCVFERWMKIGFKHDGPESKEPKEPQLRRFFGSVNKPWALECAATGRTKRGGSAESRTPVERITTAPAPLGSSPFTDAALRSLEETAYRNFLTVPGPAHRKDDLRLDQGDDERVVQYRAYLWGPRNAGFSTNARWLVRVADRFDLDSVWSTRPTRLPWPDALDAARVFGQDLQGPTSVDWTMLVEATSQAALLAVRARGQSELHFLEAGRTIQSALNVEDIDVRRLVSAVRVGQRWFTMSQHHRALYMWEARGGKVEQRGAYPLFSGDSVHTKVVRSSAGDALAIWVKTASQGWFVFPVDLETGAPDAALSLPPEELALVPRTCDPEEVGYELVAETPLTYLVGSASNVSIKFQEPAAALRVEGVEARLLATPVGLCIRDLAAQVDETVPSAVRFVRQSDALNRSIPLVVTDRSTEQRMEFRCDR